VVSPHHNHFHNLHFQQFPAFIKSEHLTLQDQRFTFIKAGNGCCGNGYDGDSATRIPLNLIILTRYFLDEKLTDALLLSCGLGTRRNAV
jgi:hypothetical protein